MHLKEVNRVVIAGGGTAGWMVATAIATEFNRSLSITLIESDEIGTVGVGEATVAKIKVLHHSLKFDERDFMRASQATFKLGISFENWQDLGKKYLHVFGEAGRSSIYAGFHHYWLKGRKLAAAADFSEYCNESAAALRQRFGLSLSHGLGYGYHIDASLYAAFLRQMAEGKGVVRKEGLIEEVRLDSENGFIDKLKLRSGEQIEGDLFIDCTGFRGRLIQKEFDIDYQDYDAWLSCDRAIAVQTEATSPPLPYTRSIATPAGWQWQIPLQHRVGNGVVYSSRFWSDDEAKAWLLDHIQGPLLTEPRIIRFRAGQRRTHWHKNCVAVGLSSGFIEPLESTSIHLIMKSTIRLLQMFPHQGIREPDVAEFNKQMQDEIESIRDFIILHYKVTNRDDSEFWRHCKAMVVPDSVDHRIELFKQSGRVFTNNSEMFDETSWLQVMLGQGLVPQQHHPIVNAMSDADLKTFLNEIQSEVASSVAQLPKHQEFIKTYCEAQFG